MLWEGGEAGRVQGEGEWHVTNAGLGPLREGSAERRDGAAKQREPVNELRMKKWHEDLRPKRTVSLSPSTEMTVLSHHLPSRRVHQGHTRGIQAHIQERVENTSTLRCHTTSPELAPRSPPCTS